MSLDRDYQGPTQEEDLDESEPAFAPGKATLVDQLGKSRRLVSDVPGRSMRTDVLRATRLDRGRRKQAEEEVPVQRKASGQAPAGADPAGAIAQ
ncbi:MAG TPA: hypothetical protein VK427_23495 [Kofleriaceae bacterium]|nr:hypothetical protein [Kofleriaceae bacterium]